MKSGYKKLLIFEILVFTLLILNSFVSSILSNYVMVAFIIILGVIFKFVFGFERDRHRYIKDIIFEVAIFLLIYLLIYYLSGLFFGFARTSNYYTFEGMFKFVIPTILFIVTKEILRYMMLTKSEGSKLLIVMTCILFIMFDVTGNIFYTNFKSSHEVFTLLAVIILPAISTNIICSYMTMKVGYKPVIFYLLVVNLYRYLLPIVPNPNQYLVSIINFLVPIILGYRIYRFFAKDRDEEEEDSRGISRKKQVISLIIPTIIVIFIVYITSGYFHYYALAIASGSMHPEIKKGDVTIIEKLDGHFDELKEGQVIAYKYSNVTIVHRLTRIMKIGDTYYFYTKGDANNDEDAYTVQEDMIIGTVKAKIPYLGLPTVWLNGL